jgi:uncharacterized protein
VSRVRILPGPPERKFSDEPEDGVSVWFLNLPAVRRARLGTFEVSIPETRHERRRGLMGHAPLARASGLLLERCRSVHTFGVRFPIDAVLLDSSYRVVTVVLMRARRVLLPRPRVRHILEVAAGQGPPEGSQLMVHPLGGASDS